MGDNRGYKVLSILALIIGIAGVTLGYAAFSNTLTITSTAEVNPDSSKFNVDFSSAQNSVVTNNITPTLSPTGVTGFTATNATINNSSDPTITNLHATFTEPGQSATYEFYAVNDGQYIAYLNSIVFSGSKTCTAANGTTQSLVNDACPGIKLSVKVGSENATETSVASISGHTLGINAGEKITVVISYESGSAIADGDFDVTFPNVVLTYESAD